MSFEGCLVGTISNKMSTGLQPANMFQNNLLDIGLYGINSLQSYPGSNNTMSGPWPNTS